MNEKRKWIVSLQGHRKRIVRPFNHIHFYHFFNTVESTVDHMLLAFKVNDRIMFSTYSNRNFQSFIFMFSRYKYWKKYLSVLYSSGKLKQTRPLIRGNTEGSSGHSNNSIKFSISFSIAFCFLAFNVKSTVEFFQSNNSVFIQKSYF